LFINQQQKDLDNEIRHKFCSFRNARVSGGFRLGPEHTIEYAKHAEATGSMTGMSGVEGMPSHGMLGSHMMPATVVSVDTDTGIMEADAGGMKLRLHFLPASLASVKAGDKIKLHMAFMK
jgi:hypothetical protein